MATRLARWLVAMVMIAVALMALSGGWRDPWIWSYLGVWSATWTFAIWTMDDDLARERFSPPSPGADRLPLLVIRVLALAHLVVGALDSGRWHVAPVPSPLRALALAGMAASFIMFFHAMRANPFFSAVVRLQDDRGHRVVDRGPYARVRHPGYAALLPAMSLSGLALGSWIAFAFGVAFAACVLRRVVFEDAFLQANLAGYAGYAQRVRYRLLPGIW